MGAFRVSYHGLFTENFPSFAQNVEGNSETTGTVKNVTYTAGKRFERHVDCAMKEEK